MYLAQFQAVSLFTGKALHTQLEKLEDPTDLVTFINKIAQCIPAPDKPLISSILFAIDDTIANRG